MLGVTCTMVICRITANVTLPLGMTCNEIKINVAKYFVSGCPFQLIMFHKTNDFLLITINLLRLWRSASPFDLVFCLYKATIHSYVGVLLPQYICWANTPDGLHEELYNIPEVTTYFCQRGIFWRHRPWWRLIGRFVWLSVVLYIAGPHFNIW